MPATGFDDTRLAARPPGGNLYFQEDQAVASKVPADAGVEPRGPGKVQARDLYHGGNIPDVPKLIFGQEAVTGQGEHIVKAEHSTGGHVSEILNFHGSPAPWVLIGILLVAGILHMEAHGKLNVGGKL